ncbi:MAG: Protoheme IX farnesyltransferase [Candidatus Omnitrophica bacterium]|nr:Protoheme IX farnesyltransferase [Candidatus Omnitrophota bacterium]
MNRPTGSASDYMALAKPRLTTVASLSALFGTLLSGENLSTGLFIDVFVGAFLVGSAANALNQLMEIDVDSLMKRTEARPLPTGRLARWQAAVFAAVLGLSGIAYLWTRTNPTTAWIGVLTLVTYLACYTPLKRITPLNTFVGAIPGALPPVMGWAATTRPLSIEAFIVFLILYLWQLPHFLCIAWIYREDYTRGGLKMLPELDVTGERTAKQILFFTLILSPVSLLPVVLGLAGWPYLAGMIAANALFIALALTLILRRFENPRRFVLTSVLYVVVLMLSAAVDRAALS